MLEFGPNGSSPKLKKPSPAVKNSEVERNYFVTFLSPTDFFSNLNMSQTMEEERVKIEQIIETKAFLDNPEALPWYEPEIQTLAPDNSELFQEYSKIPPSEITQHIKKVRDDAFSVVCLRLSTLSLHSSVSDPDSVSLPMYWQLDIPELQHPRTTDLQRSPATRQEWGTTSRSWLLLWPGHSQACLRWRTLGAHICLGSPGRFLGLWLRYVPRQILL